MTKNRIYNIVAKVFTVPLLVLLAFLAVKAGSAAGSFMFDMNSRQSFIESIDTQHFKNTMNYSVPLIDATYNSGNVNVSFTAEISNFLKGISGFDLRDPLTILNAQSSFFNVYYNKNYLPMLARRDEQPPAKTPESPLPDVRPHTPEVTEEPGAAPGTVPEKTAEQPGLIEDASSIYYDENDEKKEIPQENSVSSGSISVLNETKFKIDKAEIERLMKQPLAFKFDRKGPKILIYHTHTTESYIRNLNQLKQKDVPTSTSDSRYNVVRVGNELALNLKKYGIDVVHNGTVHDYPNYNLSYVNSLDTLTKYLKSYPSLKITFDLHRDGLGEDGKKLRAVKTVNGKNAAQVMFVIGTSQKLSHPRWKENLKLAIKLQGKLNEICPGLAKPIYVSENRYNQHLSDGSLIVEVGGDGNTLDEALETTKYLARAVNEVIK